MSAHQAIKLSLERGDVNIVRRLTVAQRRLGASLGRDAHLPGRLRHCATVRKRAIAIKDHIAARRQRIESITLSAKSILGTV